MKGEEATNGGECRVKKIGCKLGALQRAFRELALLRQGGDALSPAKDNPSNKNFKQDYS